MDIDDLFGAFDGVPASKPNFNTATASSSGRGNTEITLKKRPFSEPGSLEISNNLDKFPTNHSHQDPPSKDAKVANNQVMTFVSAVLRFHLNCYNFVDSQLSGGDAIDSEVLTPVAVSGKITSILTKASAVY